MLGEKGEAASKRAQASLALQLCDLIIGTTQLDAPLVALATNLVVLATKSSHVDKLHLKNVTLGVAGKAKALGGRPEGQGYLEVHVRLQQLKK